MPEPRKLRVFLCHASQDKAVVRGLYDRLLAEGWIDPWLDISNLFPGQDWRLAIEAAVVNADNIIVCLSKSSVTKEGYVQKEMRYAQELSLEKPEGTIFLIPLKLDDCEIPRGLQFFHWTTYFGEDKEQGYQNLLKSLKLRLDQKIREESGEAHKDEPELAQKQITEKFAPTPGSVAHGSQKSLVKSNVSTFLIGVLSLVLLTLGSVNFRTFVASPDNELVQTGTAGVYLCALSNLLAILAGMISLVKYLSYKSSNARIVLLSSIFVFLLNCLVSVWVYFT